MPSSQPEPSSQQPSSQPEPSSESGSSRPPEPQWSLVVPVKILATAKSRLAVDPAMRMRIALALVSDTVAAALSASLVRAVTVVTDDPAVTAVVTALGADVVPDEPAAGLNPALRHGARQVRLRRPQAGVVALSADLPALKPGELDDALTGAGQHERSFIPDSSGSGTVLLAAAPGAGLDPRFGPDSADRHRASGAVELPVPTGTGLRGDVDTLIDLERARRLGCGPATAALLQLGQEPGGQ